MAAAVRYKKILMVASMSCPTGESSGKVLYNMDGRSPDWKGWHFRVHDGLLSVTPPNRWCTTDFPLAHVKMLVREPDPLDPSPAAVATSEAPRGIAPVARKPLAAVS